MAYANDLDPTTPDAIEGMGQGDDRIREAKAAVIERLLTVFTDLDLDPLVFISKIIPRTALADKVIGTGQLDDNSVGTTQLADGSVTLPKIPDNILTVEKVLDHTASFKLAQIFTLVYNVPAGGLLVPANSAAETVDINVTGAGLDVPIFVTYSGVPDIGLSWTAYWSGLTSVKVRVRNHTGAPITIAAGQHFVITVLGGIG